LLTRDGGLLDEMSAITAAIAVHQGGERRANEKSSRDRLHELTQLDERIRLGSHPRLSIARSFAGTTAQPSDSSAPE
jgi:hypothetical protein